MDEEEKNIKAASLLIERLNEFQDIEHRESIIKIIQEYLFLFKDYHNQNGETANFITSICLPFSKLTGDLENDFQSMILLDTLSLFDASLITSWFTTYLKYLELDQSDIINSLCVERALLLINKSLISSIELFQLIDLQK